MTSIIDNAEIVFETEWFNVERQAYDGVKTLQGKPFYRINALDGVIVLALTASNEIVLVKQFRPALGQHTLEMPAGAVEPNETPVEAAARELYEETGYVCQSLIQLGTGHLMASRLNARQHTVLGAGASRHPSYSPREEFQVLLVSPAEMKRLVLAGGVQAVCRAGSPRTGGLEDRSLANPAGRGLVSEDGLL